MKRMNLKSIAFGLVLTALAALGSPIGLAQAQSIPITDQPLFTTAGVPPLMMMVMSRDEQLFIKAYDDYSDLDGDGILDTTYQDRFDYSGYFDPALCYTYASGQFSANAVATGPVAAGQKYPHQCSGSNFSGNFMNWVAMSRLDVLSFVLDGGRRVAPEPANGAVLERAPLPPDLHAWVKVYAGSDTNKYTPYSGTVSFCNATMSSGAAPTIRAAQGAFPEWAATALQMCNWRDDAYPAGSGGCSGAAGDNSCYDDAPKSAALATSTGLTARVQVCANASFRESFCEKYTDSSSGAVAYKPVGLLQTYGEKGLMRFGLLTGSFSKPRSGGVLRRNIGLFAGNTGARDAEGCAADDEINLNNGKFCTHSASGNKGIVSTIGALDISGYYGFSAHDWNDCNTYGILNRQGFDGDRYLNDPGVGGNKQNCAAWGNPLSEMYAEALRYISTPNPTGSSPTAAFTGGTDLAGLPTNVAWKDPYRSMSTGGNPYCANCSILVLSTGLNSFDSDEIPTVAALSRQAAASTTAVGTDEGISGTYSIGRIATGTPGNLAVGTSTATHTDLCTAKGVADLSVVRGICPDIPAMEGSYLMDGLAFDAWTTDLRPDLHSSPPAGNPVKAADYKNVVKTFSVALARNLPSFRIPVGGGAISLAPLCQANNSGSGDALGPPVSNSTNDVNWRSCYMGSVSIGQKQASSSLSPSYVYGRALDTSTSPQYGSFTFVWEDSLWGNDHENDVVTMVTYCVGAACSATQQSGRKNLDGSTFSGYDICWRAYGTTGTTSSTAGGFGAPGLATSTKDPYGNTSPCPANGRPTVASDEVLIRIENLSAYAGNAMLTGYNIAGSNSDGIKRLTLRPGNANDTLLNKSVNPSSSWYAPIVRKYRAATAAAKQLENPLFYAAKYGSFNDANSNGVPDTGEWDSQVAGVPDNFFAVTDPGKLKAQLQKIFDAVIAGASPAGSVAASASRFTVGQTLAYQASYNSDNWVGDLKGFHLNSDGSLGAQAWAAAAALPTGARNDVWIGVAPAATSTTFTAAQFTRANLPTWMQTALTAAGSWPTDNTSVDNLVAWFKGDQTNEGSAGTASYRKRDVAKRLGDIVNSSPQVAYQISYGYDQLQNPPGCGAPCTSTYAAYVASKSRTTVFVGANDGMLHAFDGSATGGQELFSYIPNAVISKLGKLPMQGYTHTYFVDGTPAIGDAYLGAWKTLLVSSAGAGAHAVFALDVTNPASFGTGSLLWEFNSTVDPDMGQFTGIPSPPTLTSDGKWVTAFGNGYNGASNKAKLFVVNVADGTALTVDPIADSANAAPNGLSTATIIDASGTCPSGGPPVCSDGVGDTIYAGDYLGNVWRFVLASNRWQLSPTTPIFKAVDTWGHKQPITSGMFAIKNPLGGVIIYFGTGKYLATGDNDPTQLQPDGNPLVNSIYAVWDDGSGTAVTRGDLQQQRVLSYTGGAFTITQNVFGYRTTAFPLGKMGWFLDLTVAATPDPLQGERVLASPTGLLSKLFVNIFRPIGDICLPAGVNSLLELDLLNGSASFPNPGGGPLGTGTGSGAGGQDIGNGPPLGSPNPVVTIPGQTGIPPIGCPPDNPNCVTPHFWCTPGVPGYPNCADPAWCQASTPGYPNCQIPADCHPADTSINPAWTTATPGYPYCNQSAQCSLIPNAGTPIGNQAFQCRAAWRQVR